jgi:glycosyltransferase involved in cell wall biosynthesis
MKKEKLSVVIIARDEEAMIGDCLKSVVWANELLVVDTGSKDRTCQIAKDHNARVIEVPWRKYEYGRWRNIGLREAKSDWIFYLDADERATPALKAEILKVIADNQHAAYEIPRRNFYLGQEMRYGGAWPDYVRRLYRKKSLKKWVKDLHEAPVIEGSWGRLKEPMIHLTHRDLTSMVEKTNQWSKIEAELLFKDYPGGHPPVTWWRFLRMMLSEFWTRGIKKQGLRDGTVGWIEVIFQMFSRFVTYARLWELQQKQK